MQPQFYPTGWLEAIRCEKYTIPFVEGQGFFLRNGEMDTEVLCNLQEGKLSGSCDGIAVSARFELLENAICLKVRIENTTSQDFCGCIGFHMGVDTCMKTYPQWHKPFFPTLLRCEKTHLWGYYMNTVGNALAIATENPVASYGIRYNRLEDGDYGHRITETDIYFFHNGVQPPRHPQNLDVLRSGQIYENTICFIPVDKQAQIPRALAQIGNIPIIQAEKYTFERGEKPQYCVLGDVLQESLQTPAEGEYGLYTLQVTDKNGKQAEASFYCRPDWDFYLKNAAKEAIAKPQKATTHVESFYGLFSAFLAVKHYKDENLLKQAMVSANEVLPLMFDFKKYQPIVIPERIQNTALLVSLLVDMYEATGDRKHLDDAAGFADWLMTRQGSDGVYRKEGRIHYTCVIYIAKAMLELALAEEKMDGAAYARHYHSAKRAIDELVASLDNIDTEGESTLEDGMISCSALQIGMFALTLPEEDRQPYIAAAKKMMDIHTCLEQQLIPDCRCNGASLRYWESQYDLMVMGNMFNSPHGWSAWTAYAHYYLYLLTKEKQYLISLMNCLGSCAQLMTLQGQLRWGYCSQPYVEAETLVADESRPLAGGGYRGKYEKRTYGESYIPMISDWYRTDVQKLVGGYEWCPLFLAEETLHVDNQGGCCDNDVHEIFKCIEETVLHKAFAHCNADGSYLTYGCKVLKENDGVQIIPNPGVTEIISNFQECD